MAKRKAGNSTVITLTHNQRVTSNPCQITMDIPGYRKDSLSIGKWNEFLSRPPTEIDLGVDLLEDCSSISCYFLDDLGSMRFKGLDGIVYYVFIDDDDTPYHIEPDRVYVYKPGEKVTPSNLPEGCRFYIVSK